MIILKKGTIVTWLFLSLIISSAFSYAFNPEIQKITYLIAFLSLVGLFFIYPPESEIRIALISVFCGLMLIFTLLPFSISEFPVNEWAIIHSLGYPIVTFLVLMIGWRLTLLKVKPLTISIIAIGMTNAIVAFMASLGYLSQLPLLGDIETGRVIFGTPLPSSAGLFNNVNYYSTVQGLCFWLYWWLIKTSKGQLDFSEKVILLLLFVTSVIGSSRGVMIALFASLLIYFVISLLEINARAKLLRIAVIFLFLSFMGGIIASNYEIISEIFRVAKGLNNRDMIWSAVYDLWRASPVLGYGNIEEISQYIESSTGSNSSIQSAYFMTLARGGILLFITTYGLIIVCVLFGLGISKRLWIEQKIAIAILVYWLVSMTVRTFSLGGLGFLPVIGTIALSSILYAGNIYNIKNFYSEKSRIAKNTASHAKH